MKLTSAGANKVLKRLQDEKNYLLSQEKQNRTYTAYDTETPVIPDYDYDKTAAAITAIDDKIVKIKHALNVINTTNQLDIKGRTMTVDEILVRMAQLNNRKNTLDVMRNCQPKTRLRKMTVSTTVPEYEIANYNIEKVRAEYNRIDAEIISMQLALDRFNQTYEFDVDIEL